MKCWGYFHPGNGFAHALSMDKEKSLVEYASMKDAKDDFWSRVQDTFRYPCIDQFSAFMELYFEYDMELWLPDEPDRWIFLGPRQGVVLSRDLELQNSWD